MNALNYLLVTMTVLLFSLTSSAQKIQSNSGNTWPQKKTTTTETTKTTTKLDSQEIDLDSEFEAIPVEEVEADELADMKQDIEEVDDLLAEDTMAIDPVIEEPLFSDSTEYEVVETKFINGQPVSTTKRLSENQYKSQIANSSSSTGSSQKTTTTVKTTSAKPRVKKKTTTTTSKTMIRKKNPAIMTSPVSLPTTTPVLTETVLAEPVTTKATLSKAASTKTTQEEVLQAKPKKKVVRRVLRRKSDQKPLSRSSNRNRTRKRVTTVQTRLPIIKKKSNRNFHITPLLGTAYGRIDGTFLTNTYDNNLDSDYAFGGGVLGEYSESDWMWGFEFGIIYNRTTTIGDRLLIPNANSVELDFMENEYLMFPVSAKFYPIKKDSFGIYAKGGIAGGVLLDSEFQELRAGTVFTSGDSAGLFKDAEFQWHVGLGGRFRINEKVGIAVDGYFYRSFTNIAEPANNRTGGEARLIGVNAFAGVVFSI